MVVDLISGVLAEVCYRKVRINEGGITELSSSRPCKFRGEDFFYVIGNCFPTYIKTLRENTLRRAMNMSQIATAAGERATHS